MFRNDPGGDERLRDLARRAAAGDESAIEELDEAMVVAGLRLEARDTASFDAALRRIIFRQGGKRFPRFVEVEWEPGYDGGDRDRPGRYAYVPYEEGMTRAALRRAFEARTGRPWSDVIFCSLDELTDEKGGFVDDSPPDDVTGLLDAVRQILKITASQFRRGDVVEAITAQDNWAIEAAHLRAPPSWAPRSKTGTITVGLKRDGDESHYANIEKAWPELEVGQTTRTSGTVERWALAPSLDRVFVPSVVAWRWAGRT